MDSGTQERVEDWDVAPFSGGIDGLRDLADDGFSGAVTAAGAWLFMLNGRIIGIFRGSLDAFENADGTAYQAPDPSLPLLFTMRELDGETQGKYYTEDTPVSEVDETLSSGSFTGYLELSEKVLSGDYYVCYYGGRALPVAFIGNAERLKTGDEAFERADDEVGIFEVKSVDIDVVELPDPDEGDEESGAAGGGAAAGGGSAAPAGDDRADADDGEGSAGAADEGGANADDGASPDPERPTEDDADRTAPEGSDATEASAGAAAGDGSDGSGTAEEPPSGTDRPADVDEGTASEPDHTSSGGETADAGGATADDGRTAEEGSEDRRRADRDGRGTEAGTDDRRRSRQGERTTEDASGARRSAERDDRPQRDERTGRSPGNERGDRASPDDRDGSRRARDDGASGRSDEESHPDEQGDAAEGRHRDADAQHGDTDRRDRDAESSANGAREGAQPEPSPDRSDGRQRRESGGAQDGRQARGSQSGSRPRRDDGVASRRDRSSGTGTDDGSGGDRDPLGPAPDSESDDDGTPFQREEQWRETTTIPSLDPDRTEEGEDKREVQPRDDRSGSPTASMAGREARSADDVSGEPFEADMLEREDRIDQLQQRVSNLEAERDQLRSEREQLAAENERLEDRAESLASEADELREENDQLREEHDQLRDENDQLRSRVTELEAEIESLESEIDRLEEELEAARSSQAGGGSEQAGGAASSGPRLGPADALDETNLFVRYLSKGQPTLEEAHDGGADKEAIEENLRLELHTGFDAGDATVEGRPFEEFLGDTIEYQFVDWAIRDLLFEIRGTGNADAMADLYDALPEVDRAELNGTVAVDDEGDEGDHGERFDVVLRDRMGDPLVVANLNDSRDPATQDMMISLQEAATRAKENHDTLASAFLVTTSYFDPGALETADEATSGSLLSRDSRRSFVKLSRKDGYHLCLVETRGGNFHVNVPDL